MGRINIGPDILKPLTEVSARRQVCQGSDSVGSWQLVGVG